MISTHPSTWSMHTTTTIVNTPVFKYGRTQKGCGRKRRKTPAYKLQGYSEYYSLFHRYQNETHHYSLNLINFISKHLELKKMRKTGLLVKCHLFTAVDGSHNHYLDKQTSKIWYKIRFNLIWALWHAWNGHDS